MWDETKRIFLESAGQLIHAAARLLPNVLAMLLFFALAALLAVAARAIVRRTCERLGMDRRLRAWGIVAPAEAGRTAPTQLLARVAFWSVLAMGALLGLSVLPTSVTGAVSLRLLAYVPRLLLAVVIAGFAVGLSRVVERTVLIGAVNMGMQSARLLSLGARWLVVVFGGAIALEHAGLGTSVVALAFGLLFGGIVLALALAIGLGSKELVARSLQRRFPGPGAPDAPREPPPPAQIHHL